MKLVLRLLGTILLAIFFIFGLNSCKKIEKYPDRPQIAFKKITIVDSLINSKKTILARIHFSIIDGDGNVGLYSYDTTSPFIGENANNLNCYWRIVSKGKIIKGEKLNIPTYNYRIPFLGEEREKTLFADMFLDIDINPFLKTYKYDSIYFCFNILDRDFNISNTDSTSKVKLTNYRR